MSFSSAGLSIQGGTASNGQQILSGFHGYFDQHQYFPLFAYDGATGFPLAAWLRPGTVHASCGAIDTLRVIVERLRAAWPHVLILVRGDNGLAVPALYEYCEAQGLLYAFGYATNAVLEARTDPLLRDLQEYHHWYGRREPAVQRFEAFEDYQAGTWSRPRRIVAKIEITRLGSNRRYVVTNMSGDPGGIYHGFYVQRGRVPEQPIGEMKNGLAADRLSFHHFRANAWKLLEHTLAYALVVLHREATAAVPEVVRNGILVEPENPEALADGITRLYRDPCLCSSLASAGCQDVERFDVHRVAELFLSEVAKVAPEMAGSRTCGSIQNPIPAGVSLQVR